MIPLIVYQWVSLTRVNIYGPELPVKLFRQFFCQEFVGVCVRPMIHPPADPVGGITCPRINTRYSVPTTSYPSSTTALVAASDV